MDEHRDSQQVDVEKGSDRMKCNECGRDILWNDWYWTADQYIPEQSTYCNDCIHKEIDKAFKTINPDFAAALEIAVDEGRKRKRW